MKAFTLSKTLFLIFFFNCLYGHSQSKKIDLVNNDLHTNIVFAGQGTGLDSIVACHLANDIQLVSGYRPLVTKNLKEVKGNVILIGHFQANAISPFLNSQLKKSLQNQWERYAIRVITKPNKDINQLLVVAGSDARGTAYGVFQLSEWIGVSPWYWWADVHPQKKYPLSITVTDLLSKSPSVRYRGIFINDEDWGLQPWAAKTFEPETGDIGPKTYSRIFELLLRLKANLIWPAMHPSTKAFFSIEGNAKMAKLYEMVVGSSHAEPLLRNNVGEWNEKTMGAFNYLTNKIRIQDYWNQRIQDSKGMNAIYTMGMRGVHDSGLEGIKNNKDAVPLLEQIFSDQRQMLSNLWGKSANLIPQAFTVYKEVLDIYDAGLKLPADITLVWPDDNYGYLQRLNNTVEAKRKGGSGVYYHTSYWGRPHDYLWLNTSSPLLMQEEMTKAYQLNAKNIWVLNVGDIKPAEYNIQCFLDMAYWMEPFLKGGYAKKHLNQWMSTNIDHRYANTLTELSWKYYQLAFERKPEFMGWSQTEPTTKTKPTAYNHFNFNDQAELRLKAYDSLELNMKGLRDQIQENRLDAFDELVQYPILGASLMNKKFLYYDKANIYAKEGRLIANHYAELSKSSFEQIQAATTGYNKNIANGKWNQIMLMNPRNLPVFQKLDSPLPFKPRNMVWHALPEGNQADTALVANYNHVLSLPTFQSKLPRKYFIDIYLCQSIITNIKLKTNRPWIKITDVAFTLTPKGHLSQKRVWVTIDWEKAPKTELLDGIIYINSIEKEHRIAVKAINNQLDSNLSNFKGAVEENGFISIWASHFQKNESKGILNWKMVTAPGLTNNNMMASPLSAAWSSTDLKRSNPILSYQFWVTQSSNAKLFAYSLPTHSLHKGSSMSYEVQIDSGNWTTVSFETVGRSEEWKNNVLGNEAVRVIELNQLSEGVHNLKIRMVDPGVILTRFIIDLGGFQSGYGLVPSSN